MQLIVTTHSDALVSALSEEASSIMICEYLGGTRLSRLDPEKLKHWLDKYRLGDMWIYPHGMARESHRGHSMSSLDRTLRKGSSRVL